ncbi:FKBP-type peptidyl-prolyl cis-trans isomerase [Candidatus Rhabdochlamydia sp. T3358]|uniref:FKBP-type peptidyl-prolyl cis-trans isomerase n=1 Tax=Candidatus Rhabdochlamydia sp. T3358 TaxID=2099795 RepID=UPI0010B0514B|nr:FKBP-type peptidyl-prolyl cis-trans isomerase [Candidatus Rhabdochlamydia sp. T3358]VHO04352.1 hypothetical protein RHT_01328 [Candidatus Rhabdochlamydia sp. T3358]
MIQKILFLIVASGCIFLYKDPIFALFSDRNRNLNNVMQHLTKKEQEKLPFLIALSLKEMVPEKNLFSSFIEGVKTAEQERANNYQKKSAVQAYLAYTTQLLDPGIARNLETSQQYLQKKQEEKDSISLINNKICYKTLKNGSERGIEDKKINKVKINFTVKDMEDNFLAGNYVLSGPISCALSELVPGMAYAMLGMRLNELREIYIHPEFAYGVFSDFGKGKALSIQVELVECEATDTVFYPCLIPVDLATLHCPNETNITSLQKDYISSCGKIAWSFYKQKLPQLELDSVLSFLQKENAALSIEDRESLYKLQWLIYKN